MRAMVLNPRFARSDLAVLLLFVGACSAKPPAGEGDGDAGVGR